LATGLAADCPNQLFLQVWKREQQAAAEKKKLEELKQQYEEERRNQELLDIAHKAGHGA
jgi:cell division protein FtsL